MHVNQQSAQLHLYSPWSSNHPLESCSVEPTSTANLSHVISQRWSPLQNCFGFVDVTVRPIARPDNNQRIVYNGHKRVHAVKFQSLALPNGIIGHLYDPVGKYLELF